MSTNIFLRQLEKSPESGPEANAFQGTKETPNIFLSQIEGKEIPTPDALWKKFTRPLVQPLLGAAKRMTWPADIAKAVAPSAARGLPSTAQFGVSPLGLSQIKERFPEADIQIPKEVGQELAGYVPTQESIEEFVEKKTGFPLRPKGTLDEILRMGGTAASFRPGGLKEKATAGIVAPSVKEAAKAVGVPEWLSDLLGFTSGQFAPTFQAATRTSGLTPRRFEKLKKPTKVSPERHKKITEAVEGDVRKTTDEILGEHPDYRAIQDDPEYGSKLAKGFEKVRELASQITEKIKPRHLSSFMKRRFARHRRESKGILPSESEQTFRSEFKNFIGDVEQLPEEMAYDALVDQYRKNNDALTQYFEPGKSKAFNTGKRDALLEFNRSIEELFETIHPDSEFTRLFREQNKKWTQLMDADHIESTLGKVFKDGKITFSEVSKFLDPSKVNLRRPFQRLMGKEGFSKFESLMKDLRSIKAPYSMLKKAESAGFGNLAKTAAAYMIHPKAGKLYTGYKLIKGMGKALLDKPQLVVNWKSGLNALKRGNYKEAEEQFATLDSEMRKTAEKTRPLERRARSLPEEYASPESITREFPSPRPRK